MKDKKPSLFSSSRKKIGTSSSKKRGNKINKDKDLLRTARLSRNRNDKKDSPSKELPKVIPTFGTKTEADFTDNKKPSMFNKVAPKNLKGFFNKSKPLITIISASAGALLVVVLLVILLSGPGPGAANGDNVLLGKWSIDQEAGKTTIEFLNEPAADEITDLNANKKKLTAIVEPTAMDSTVAFSATYDQDSEKKQVTIDFNDNVDTYKYTVTQDKLTLENIETEEKLIYTREN